MFACFFEGLVFGIGVTEEGFDGACEGNFDCEGRHTIQVWVCKGGSLADVIAFESQAFDVCDFGFLEESGSGDFGKLVSGGVFEDDVGVIPIGGEVEDYKDVFASE